MQKLAVVIPHFNHAQVTIECLLSLCKSKKLDEFEYEIIVVDNGSLDPFTYEKKCDLGEIIIIRNSENKGFSGGANTGIRYALKGNSNAILLLNNDTLLDEHLLEELLKGMRENPDGGAFSPAIYFAKGFEYHKKRYTQKEQGKVFWYAGGKFNRKNVYGIHRGVDEVDVGQYQKIEQTDFVSGCCMLLKKDVLEKSGLFDERYFLYYEDADLSFRIKKLGYKLFYIPQAALWHKNAQSSGGSGSSIQDYFITRNRLLFGLRHMPLRAKIALLRESIQLLFKGRPWQKKGVIDFYIEKFGKGSFNL